MTSYTISPLPASRGEEATLFIRKILQTEFGDPARLVEMSDIEGNYRRAGGEFFMATDAQQKIVGTIAVKDRGQRRGYLGRFYIAPELRRSGLGLQLFENLLAFCETHNLREIYLETTPAYAAAVKFFTKHKFKEVPPAEYPSDMDFHGDTTVLKRTCGC